MNNLNKSNKKGTPQYDEWLRKYRLHHQQKSEDSSKGKNPNYQNILSPVSSSAKDIREIRQTNAAIADVKLNPELLKNTQQPVFANLFGNYPIEPLKFRDRIVTSPVEEVDVALAQEPEFLEDSVWDDPNWIATEKVDGFRCTIICTPEATRLTARRQKGVKDPPSDYSNNLPHIRDLDLYSVLGDTIIDSECVCSNPVESSPGKWCDSLTSTEVIIGQKKDLNICVQM